MSKILASQFKRSSKNTAGFFCNDRYIFLIDLFYLQQRYLTAFMASRFKSVLRVVNKA